MARRRLLVTGLVLATFVAGLIGIELSDATDVTASWWPAAGVGVVALFLSPRSWWGRLVAALFLANLLANIVGGHPWDASVGLALVDALEVVLVGVGTRAVVGRHLESVADLGWLVGI